MLRGEEAGEGAGRRDRGPDEGVRGSQVVEQPGGLVGIGRANRDVEDAA